MGIMMHHILSCPSAPFPFIAHNPVLHPLPTCCFPSPNHSVPGCCRRVPTDRTGAANPPTNQPASESIGNQQQPLRPLPLRPPLRAHSASSSAVPPPPITGENPGENNQLRLSLPTRKLDP